MNESFAVTNLITQNNILNIQMIFYIQYKLMISSGKSTLERKAESTNLAAIVCYSSSKQIVLQKNVQKQKSSKNRQFLVIDRETNNIKAETNFNEAKMIKRTFSAFLGITMIEGENFIVFCEEVKVACSVSKINIFEISSLFFFSFKEDHKIKKLPSRSEIFSKIRDFNKLLQVGFYFSHGYSITRPFEYRQLSPSEKFTWNFRFLKDLKDFPEWRVPIIQGFVSSFEILVQGTKIDYILISRRSIKKSGTRYFDRGINDGGFVANFVESEQIFKINEFIVSDIQIRGNVPVFFQQKGLTTKIKLTRGCQLTNQTYQKHIKVLQKYYERVFIVNLLSIHKKGELILINQFENHIKNSPNKNIKYLYYDFHTAVHGGHFENVDKTIKQIKDMKLNLKFYLYDTKNDKVLLRPQGVFRSNCLDCLDRTNFFQAKLAIITMEQILSCFKIKFQKSLLEQMNDPNDNSGQVVNFRKTWADNGDMISYHYTGTGSTHTDIIRDGKRGILGGFKHKYKSVARFYNQNFWDFYKMKLIDLLFDENTAQIQTQTIPALINEREAQFCQRKLIDVYLFTWKAPKKAPSSITLFPNNCDLLAVNIQEVADEQKWIQLIKEAADKTNYLPIAQKISNNNLLIIFAKKQLKDHISNVEVTKVKFKSYYNQYLSSKCAVIIRCMIYSNKVTFIGCQLQFGRQYAQNRIKNLKDLHKFAFQQIRVGQKASESIINDDVIFLFGNINTNISPKYKDSFDNFNKSVTNGEKASLQQRRLIEEMIETGQFSNIQQSLLPFRYYDEEQIKFFPTYKYNKSKQSFDPQVSGWPDRIWYSTENKIICSRYGIVEEMRQQHVPVYASYQIQLDDINQDARISISEEVFCRVSESRGYLQEPNDEEDDVFQIQQQQNREATRALDPIYE